MNELVQKLKSDFPKISSDIMQDLVLPVAAELPDANVMTPLLTELNRLYRLDEQERESSKNATFFRN
ncbi:hypothetical protein RvY_12947 [Ramazzottius varieornatus]|uniref:Uncharacterized protein n=1 Tax=Ramazzottius varieornatus TaxID=947166 RepID=A0A1D1VN63_RAMVA|nr:hypothetical protein RvY_12947 [Ramazzottius varieornatus]